jgi:hypothetical protein
MRPIERVALGVLVAGFVVSPLFAQAPQAKGKFTSKSWEFESTGAYAYPGEVGFEDEQGILVAVSNAEFAADFLDRYWDRQDAIDRRFAGEGTFIVTFQFAEDGAYQGMSYSFGSGDGCGHCYASETVSTVKISGGRLRGKIALAPKPGETSWDLDLDVPVAPAADHGTPLPDGGGEVGAAYATYDKALKERDAYTLGTMFTEKMAAALAANPDGVIKEWREDHPDTSYRVVKGFLRGERALLVIDGEMEMWGKVDVETHFHKEGGAWKVVDEMKQAVD